MTIDVSSRLHVTSGELDRRRVLPEIPDAQPYSAPILDRIGAQLQSRWPMVAAGAIGGGVIGSKLLRGGGGIFRGLLGGVAGALAGASVLLGGLTALAGNRAHERQAPPESAQPARTDVAARERVKVMTWNLHGGMGGPGAYGSSEAELDRIAEAVRREQPDVLLLQEVDRFATRSNHTDVLAELDERLDPDAAVGAGAVTTVLGRDQHTAVMTFNGFTISDARNLVHQDPRGGGIGVRASAVYNQLKQAADGMPGVEYQQTNAHYQARNTIEALVRTPEGSDVRVLSGHYEWPNARYDHQQRQIGSIASALDAWEGPTIIGADFNILDGSGRGANERALLATAGLRDTLDGVAGRDRITMTHVTEGDITPQQARSGGIDRIYASDHSRVISSEVIDTGTASDHLPVVTELELTPGS